MMAFFIRVVQVHERLQHAISQSALEIAGISYLYGISGVLDVQREAEALTERGVDKITDTIGKVAQFNDWLPQSVSNEIDRQFADIAPALNDTVNGFLFGNLAGFMTGKYLNNSGSPGIQNSLDGSNIAGESSGLDFRGSSFLTNGGEDVKVNVSYTFMIPIPVKWLSRMGVTQSAYARAWLFGDKTVVPQDDPVAFEDDIWSLGNFERGNKIRGIFHANLPNNFPVIASYSSGVATGIHSLDTTADSYQTPKGIGKKIDEYVDELVKYKGQETPYGSNKIVIPPGDIKAKRLVLVIPRNEISPEVSSEIDRCIRNALDKGIILQVERYATKNVENIKDS
jgi:hypothetical protein